MQNTPATRQDLCLALDFITVLTHKKNTTSIADNAETARYIAQLIDAFCQHENTGTEKFTSAQVMASVIAKTIRARGFCNRADMLTAGFSAQEIEKNWNIAYALAHVQLSEE